MSMSDQQKRVRRRFTAQQKVAILKEHLVEKAAVSEVCDKHGLNPTAFYRWQKEFFENGPAAFETRRSAGDAKSRRLEERVEKLTAKLARKDEVIAELMEDHVRLKKSLGED
jgi:transposase-like protein